MDRDELTIRVQKLYDMLVAFATGGDGDRALYSTTRSMLHSDPDLKAMAPPFLKSVRSLDDFFYFIKGKFKAYQDRRDFLREQFAQLFAKLEEPVSPVHHSTATLLRNVDSQSVQLAWRRAVERLPSDPEGAITAARTLVESSCKHILEVKGETIDEGWDLPKLYATASKSLNLAPAQHSEEVFKQILGGCQSVVNGICGLRNRFGDAHGQGRKPRRPAARHAELAVNLAGSMSVFLLRTLEARQIEHAPAQSR